MEGGGGRFFPDESDSSFVLYIGCLYWAVATLSTLGYGDIIPTTDIERAFTCLSALVGASIYAYMVGAVCGIVAGMNEKNTRFYQQIDNLNHFMVRVVASCASLSLSLVMARLPRVSHLSR